MKRIETKIIADIIYRAENDHWHNLRSLVKLLSFAAKLGELARQTRFAGDRGRRAASELGLLLVLLVEDPARAGDSRSGPEVLATDTWGLARKAWNEAHADAQLINGYVLELLNAYAVKDAAFVGLLPLPSPSNSLSNQQFYAWYKWAYDFFYPVE
jgi:hypothetical protein